MKHSLVAVKESAFCLNNLEEKENMGDELESLDDGVVPIMFTACDGIAVWIENNFSNIKWGLKMHECC